MSFPNVSVGNLVRVLLILAFLNNCIGPRPGYAQELILPKPGVMVSLSPAYTPTMVQGIKIHEDNPFRFDFIVNMGDSPMPDEALKEESKRLIKYFMAGLTIPETDLWVNLSPYEKERIVPTELGQTEMGRDLLAQDYMLKQIMSSLSYPEEGLGKQFWQEVYKKAKEVLGTTEIPLNTFNKVWIVPDEAEVFEQGNTALVVNSHLKVMMEEDYLAKSKNTVITQSQTSALTAQITKEILLPAIEKEVNEGKNFATLRQVYNSLILAYWYKQRLKESILGKVYVDKGKVNGINSDDPKVKEKIYQQYLQAYKKGVFNFIKEDIDPISQQAIPRKYFSGGWDGTDFADVVSMKSDRRQLSPMGERGVQGATQLLQGSGGKQVKLLEVDFKTAPLQQIPIVQSQAMIAKEDQLATLDVFLKDLSDIYIESFLKTAHIILSVVNRDQGWVEALSDTTSLVMTEEGILSLNRQILETFIKEVRETPSLIYDVIPHDKLSEYLSYADGLSIRIFLTNPHNLLPLKLFRGATPEQDALVHQLISWLDLHTGNRRFVMDELMSEFLGFKNIEEARDVIGRIEGVSIVQSGKVKVSEEFIAQHGFDSKTVSYLRQNMDQYNDQIDIIVLERKKKQMELAVPVDSPDTIFIPSEKPLVFTSNNLNRSLFSKETGRSLYESQFSSFDDFKAGFLSSTVFGSLLKDDLRQHIERALGELVHNAYKAKKGMFEKVFVKVSVSDHVIEETNVVGRTFKIIVEQQSSDEADWKRLWLNSKLSIDELAKGDVRKMRELAKGMGNGLREFAELAHMLPIELVYDRHKKAPHGIITSMTFYVPTNNQAMSSPAMIATDEIKHQVESLYQLRDQGDKKERLGRLLSYLAAIAYQSNSFLELDGDLLRHMDTLQVWLPMVELKYQQNPSSLVSMLSGVKMDQFLGEITYVLQMFLAEEFIKGVDKSKIATREDALKLYLEFLAKKSGDSSEYQVLIKSLYRDTVNFISVWIEEDKDPKEVLSRKELPVPLVLTNFYRYFNPEENNGLFKHVGLKQPGKNYYGAISDQISFIDNSLSGLKHLTDSAYHYQVGGDHRLTAAIPSPLDVGFRVDDFMEFINSQDVSLTGMSKEQQDKEIIRRNHRDMLKQVPQAVIGGLHRFIINNPVQTFLIDATSLTDASGKSINVSLTIIEQLLKFMYEEDKRTNYSQRIITISDGDKIAVSRKMRNDPAMSPEVVAPQRKGGIDLNASLLKMNIKTDGKGVVLPLSMQDLSNIRIEGLTPEILGIRRATMEDLPFLINLQPQ